MYVGNPGLSVGSDSAEKSRVVSTASRGRSDPSELEGDIILVFLEYGFDLEPAARLVSRRFFMGDGSAIRCG